MTQRVSDQSFRSSHPSSALHVTQRTPALFENAYSPRVPFTVKESPDQWATYEHHLLVCLRTGDDKSAHLCLDRLTERFGPANERIMGLRGLYQEATAKDNPTLQTILGEYDTILQDNPVNVPILKRRIALLRSLDREEDAISALVDYVGAFPTDAESWCELADCYQANGMSAQAIFSLEEALLVVPNSWTLHARLAELLYISTKSADATVSSPQILARSIRHYLRSLELCDTFARGLYGLILITSQLIQHPEYLAGGSAIDGQVPSKEVLERLNSMALQKAEALIQSQQKTPNPDVTQDGIIALKELVQQK
ncbi:hypothetical protein BGW36DRAFT_142381 [Talaromyces proteolyticus]|uniref:ER membrane protein complex subunit 2 n=1 Tax=Talaromyces proteolyticus TaxID=1131652 RepID=A0AAD4Q192_9EURO|nr:uncharacterized protein BGW36DRAFT_142381 [Talaromyces proteolyticus]KAH8698250.1 hypothetical protein BGW36DRAFT_142381 [Talaromyces proteolyticus]